MDFWTIPPTRRLPRRMTNAEGACDGVLPLDKPSGPTSHDMVSTARRALRTRRIGHTGTLDPFASGLLLLCIGSTTRIAEYLAGLDKRYTARVKLGVATDSDDLTGEILSEHDATGIDAAGVEAALEGLRGDILQTPPVYSAKKRGGERAYAAARAGRPVNLEPVQVRVHELKLIDLRGDELELEVLCGSGTYIRAIARDLGRVLGVGGHLTALRRTAVGAFSVVDAVTMDDLRNGQQVSTRLIPPADALTHLPRVAVDEGDIMDLRHGRAVRTQVALPDAEVVVVTSHAGDLVAMAEISAGSIRPRKVFL
jgi:tRNA pseudouridine55 synthase